MRRRLSILALITTTLLCFAALASRDVFAQQKPNPGLVYQVTSVELGFEKRIPPNALVKSKGIVRTPGYKNPRLEAVVYIAPPADGVQELRFMAEPPSGTVIQVLTEIETPLLRIENVPDWFKGVRVIAETNQIEKLGR